MKNPHAAVVTATVGAHLGYLIYLPSGGFLALRWPRTIWLHVATVCWGAGVVALGWSCPLTRLERWARDRAGMDPLPEGGFIDRYVAGVCYPAGRTETAQALAFAAAATSWIAVAAAKARPCGAGSRFPPRGGPH